MRHRIACSRPNWYSTGRPRLNTRERVCFIVSSRVATTLSISALASGLSIESPRRRSFSFEMARFCPMESCISMAICLLSLSCVTERA